MQLPTLEEAMKEVAFYRRALESKPRFADRKLSNYALWMIVLANEIDRLKKEVPPCGHGCQRGCY